jgi:DNA primase
VAPSGTALTAAQVAALDSSAGPLAHRGVAVAFDADPAGREAALRSYPPLRAAGAWPTIATLANGEDPASHAQHAGPGALRAALDAATALADLVVDERLDRWTDRLQWLEGKVGAARDTAQLLATLPPEHIGPQVARLADRLKLDHATVTAAVVDALAPDADTPPRLAQWDRRDVLDQDHTFPSPATAARLARIGYPARLRPHSLTASPATSAEPNEAEDVAAVPTADSEPVDHGTSRGSRQTLSR